MWQRSNAASFPKASIRSQSVRDGRPRLAHRHAMAMHRMARDGAVDHPGQQRRHAGDEREVFLAQMPAGELLGQAAVGGVGLGDQQHAGRVLVEPVHDARSFHAADPAQLALAVGEQRVHHGIRPGAHAGMHNHARGFVEAR